MNQGHTPLYVAVLKNAVRITEPLIAVEACVNVVGDKVCTYCATIKHINTDLKLEVLEGRQNSTANHC